MDSIFAAAGMPVPSIGFDAMRLGSRPIGGAQSGSVHPGLPPGCRISAGPSSVRAGAPPHETRRMLQGSAWMN
jgi:hypothetical protein